ncbi:MAG: type II toxin-antitoxin system HicA family toxin [Moorea sp. SIO1F2]|uniref:type II toxin-antitoxin system HicA family toxin n=1 Tax=unclassified Moorena TaxID=2683338 RepID=UPI0013BC041B|nr:MULTISPECIES: type II toxin-antitoxin system HicA family toxin [unclassified Moorena]NEN95576.1 type II toxin-antitoxin system HicA family toxin [Moorena sp. SIO3I7]NEO65058.1 type II toxin-antitoxin system HicA family toxin [Moorena sp. SIO4G2]NEO06950.1 type II toxin-antitoxin system HicA family toxin [Moorena sp. SIO3I8]NEO22225.1 type II toxin-antitoxin system HicA family toxin [Moorena sp. SIO4A5]NEP23977.1 type II toxin-antitoxin system HicA family toxin [Moorena sp. SIO3I6]
MKSISGKALCKIVEKRGWVLKRINSSHHIYSKKGVQAILSIPVHGNRDLPTGILSKLMRDANLREEDLGK